MKSQRSVSQTKTRINIEQLNVNEPEKTREIKANLAKILQISETKNVKVEPNFFQQNYGTQEEANNQISKSVDNFFRNVIVDKLKLNNTSKVSVSSFRPLAVQIQTQETSGKEFWKKFKEQKKEFENKIYLHESI